MAETTGLGSQVKTFWGSLSPSRRVSMVALTVGCLGLIGLLVHQATRANYAVLFDGLAEQDASAVVQSLSAQRVPYTLSSDGRTVRVPQGRVAELRIELAGQGIPTGGTVGFDIFDESPLGMTDFLQHQNEIRAIQGELTRTIRGLDPVESVRVHVTMPEDTVFVREATDPTASVVLRLKAGRRLSERQVNGIINLVAGAVRGMRPEGVVVVDAATGETLTPEGGDPAADRGTWQEQFRRAYEEQRERQIVTALERVAGPGNVVARVAATFDFTERTVQQVQMDRPAAMQTDRELEITPGDGGVPGGVIGSDSELGEDQIATLTESGARLIQRETTRSEAGSTTTSSQQPGGRLVRQTASVLIHERPATVASGAGGEPGGGDGTGTSETAESIAWTPEQLAQFENIVKMAIGFSEESDAVTVASLPFLPPADQLGGDDLYRSIEQRQWIMSLVRLGLICAAAFLLYWTVLRPVKQQVLRPQTLPSTQAAGLLGQRVGDLEDGAQAAARLEGQAAATPDQTQPGQAERPRALTGAIPIPQTGDQGLNESIRQMAQTSPAQAAAILKTWLSQA